MLLRFTSLAIAQIEAANNNQAYYRLFEPPKMHILAQFIQKGLNLPTIIDAHKEIDVFLASGKDVFELATLIGDALRSNGFFQKEEAPETESQRADEETAQYAPNEVAA